MSWTRDDCPGHDGELIGLVAEDPGDGGRRDGFRELHPDTDAAPDFLRWVAVACSCGWRSPRMEAPIDASWRDGQVDTSEWFEARCRQIWRAHAIATVFADREAAVRG
jgi:hypothetical protein